MKNQIQVIYLSKKYLLKFKNFIKINHSKTHILSKSDKLINWLYKDQKHYNFALAINDHKIVGVQGYVPFSKFDRKLKDTCFLSYWRVNNSMIPGIGLKLFDKIKNQNYKFLAVLGFDEKLSDYHRWQGFKIGKLNHHFLINKDVKKTKIIKKKFRNKFLKKKFEVIEVNKKNIFKIEDKVFNLQYPPKSKKYILNRYIKNSFYKYKVYYLKSSQNKIIIVFRNINIKKTNLLKIVDVIGNNNNIKYTGEALQSILKKFNAEYLDLYSYGINDKNLKFAGFINRYETNEIIPDHFEPFENKNIDINFGYIGKKNAIISFFKGDGDMDRPSKIKMNKK